MAVRSYHRGLRQMFLAPWNSTGSYGTAYQILGARNMSVEYVIESDELMGDDVVLDAWAKLVSVTVNLEQAAVDLAVIDYFLGGTLTSTADYENFMIAESDEIPYVGIAGKVVGSGGTSDLHLFVAKAKLSGNLTLTAQTATYMLPSATFKGVSDGASGMMTLRKFTAPTALTIPLKTTVGL